MLYNTKYVAIGVIVATISVLELVKTEEVDSERKPRALAFQPFKSSSPDFKLSNFFIDKYLNELKGNNGGSNGPALFPNDGPPPPRPPLVVTSRPLVEQIARSELNPSPQDNANRKSSIKQPSLYERLVNRFGNYPSSVDTDLRRQKYAEILKKSKDSQHGAQNSRNIYDPVEEKTNLPPIFKALGNFAKNKLQEQKYKEYSDEEYQDGDDLQVREPLPKISAKAINVHNEQNSHYDKNQEYAFSYAVKDDHTGDDFSHKQSSSGQATNGEYRVKLPDGRMQVVTFTADEGGYKADVRYDDVQIITSPGQKVQNIQSNRVDYEENTVKPIVESKEYEQIQGSKEYYEDYGVDYGNGRPSNDETIRSYTNTYKTTNNAQNEPVQNALGRIVVPGNKFQILRYTSTPKYAHDYDYNDKDVIEITPKPIISGQRNQYGAQEPSLYNRVTPNYISIINQIPYSTRQTVLEADITDGSNNEKEYDQYVYTTTRAPNLEGLTDRANESTRISLLDGFRNIFKSTLAPFTYKPLLNSYNNYRFNPSRTSPSTPTVSFNNFDYNPSTSIPTPINDYNNFKYPSTSNTYPINSYNNYKYNHLSSTRIPINSYNNYNYNPSTSTSYPIKSSNLKYVTATSTPNPINFYSNDRYNHLSSTPSPINSYNSKYNPSSVLQQSNDYKITTLKPHFKLENSDLKPTYKTILANKLYENNYRSNSYYTNEYSPVSVLNKLGFKDENKYFNGNGVFPYASASNTISSTAKSLDLVREINNSTDTVKKSLKQKNAQKISIENLKLKEDNKNGTKTDNKTGQLLPNLHHTVTPNLYSYNNYGHLDTKKY